MRFFDTHTHLCDPQFDSDRTEVLIRAKENGIDTLIEVSDSPETWEKAEKLSKESFAHSPSIKTPNIYWTCGFHPHHAEDGATFDFELMKKTASLERCLAIGEIGLDYFKSSASKESQISCFQKSLSVALELKKPVVIHCRDAQEDVLRILGSIFGEKLNGDEIPGVIHCFSGDLNYAQACLNLGFYIGVDGPLTYPKANSLREVISEIPIDKIVLETDAPYLPPQNHRGKRNEPSYIPLIARDLARILNKNLSEIAKITSENAKKLFRIKE